VTALALDHVVVAAASLAQGDAWCEATFGFVPTAGGQHALFGTHNRVFRIDAPAFPQAYFEIIAIDPAAPTPGRPRWFGLDDAGLQAALHRDGPQLIHWVARCDDLPAARAAFGADDPGEPLAAERSTPAGLLRWTITVRPDGRRLFGGALPTLIGWRGPHPVDALPASGLRLEALALGALPPAVVTALPAGVSGGGRCALQARIATPRGPVALRSAG
jgi:hypothetical protein